LVNETYLSNKSQNSEDTYKLQRKLQINPPGVNIYKPP